MNDGGPNHLESLTQPYDSRLLTQSHFRLIELIPGKWEDPLKCSLEQFTLDRPVSYRALSYAWGSSATTSPIQANGVEMQITKNLETALKNLREEAFAVTLWVDALCINQNDLDERQAQVQIMRDIYSCAASVVVFLGDGASHFTPSHYQPEKPADYTFPNDLENCLMLEVFLRQHGTLANVFGRGFEPFCLVALFAQHNSKHIDDLLGLGEKVLQELFEDLRMMLLSPWWSRIWVFQEIIVSKKISIQYGSSSVPWGVFRNASHNIYGCHATQSRRLQSENLKVLDLFRAKICDIEDGRKRWILGRHLRKNNAGAGLLAHLRDTNGRKASDDRDKVYALLGLLPYGLDIMADYHMTVSDVFIRTVRNIIRVTRNLDVLVGDLGRKNRNDLPSWIPDWSAIIHDKEILRSKCVTKVYNACKDLKFVCGSTLAHDSVFPLGSYREFIYASLIQKTVTGRGTYFVIQPDEDKAIRLLGHYTLPQPEYNLQVLLRDYIEILFGRLSVTASYVGEIIFSSDPFYASPDMKMIEQLCRQWATKLPSESAERPFIPQVTIDTLRALVFDLIFVEERFRRSRAGDEIHLQQWFRAKVSPTEKAYEDVLGFDDVLSFMSFRRRLFMTGDGKLGWGPNGLLPGDKVFVLPGGKVPFVIRGVDCSKPWSTGKMIGDCFLQGVMDGEQLEDSSSEDRVVAEECAPIIAEFTEPIRALSEKQRFKEHNDSSRRWEEALTKFASFAQELKSANRQKGLRHPCVLCLE
ncbi:heterokaryon incompatibility protein-domain-containing protein [Hypoxylon trugodes]|uniref:heterokaryon incompatibility protein-domain-containing protein n=1 Tax=Hypoxylon trugodes TaxID=326681 RepID=UPI002192804F|nr:heterokaryon incompatibility protein-domain-containing protein [Hypoxylon trugodes]KAI1387159.1 heterokaryon incompatibility protein-domain-containing protein [Hypoxylon trugodes]